MVISAAGVAGNFFSADLDQPYPLAARKNSRVELSLDDQKKVEVLKKRDAEVKKHEQAHLSAAGSYAKGAPKYDYETGPDGTKYAVGGEVDIDTSPVRNDPAATIRKAETVKRAALAPEAPSPRDRRVAAEADATARVAQKELTEERSKKITGYGVEGSPVKIVTAGHAPAPQLDLVG